MRGLAPTSRAYMHWQEEDGRLSERYDRIIRKLVADREREWERDYAGMREMQAKYIEADQRLRALRENHVGQQVRTFLMDPRWDKKWEIRRECGVVVYRVPEPHEYVISVSGQPELARHIGDCGERVILERVEDGAR